MAIKIYHLNIEYESGTGKTKTREVLTKVMRLEDVRELLTEAYRTGWSDGNRGQYCKYADEVIAGMKGWENQTCK